MPTTLYNVQRILARAPEQSPQTVLDVLNEIQLIVYSQDCIQTQKIEANGKPPYLVTQDKVFEYDAPDDCRRTASVFLSNRNRAGYNNGPVGPMNIFYFQKTGYREVKVATRDATIDVPAKVYFERNPGATTDIFYHLYYIKAKPLTSIDVQLTVPEETHWMLRKAVISMLTGDSYGNSDQEEAMLKRVAREIRNSLNRGYQSGVGMTPIQPELQDGENFGSFYYGHRI